VKAFDSILILTFHLILVSYSFLFQVTASAAERICAEFELAEKIEPALTDAEKRLICGDLTQTEGRSEGWLKIPRNQALFNLTNYLQGRGYLNPVFEQSDKHVRILPGEITRVSSVHAKGGPWFFDITRKRRILGEPLTPELLNTIEAWTQHELARGGYPCAKIRAAGDPKKGAVLVQIDAGEPLIVNSIQFSPGENFNPHLLRRFHAFSLGSLYDADLLAISADRAIIDGIVERTIFTPVCLGNSEAVYQDAILGEPKVFTLGVSINTQEVGIVKVSLKSARWGESASSATIEGRASFKVQQISTFLDWYFRSPTTRASLRPQFEVVHRNENPFEFYSERVFTGYSTHWDSSQTGFGLLVGPQLLYYQQRRGSEVPNPHTLNLHSELRMISHEYEFNRSKLSGGYRVFLDADVSSKNILSSFGAMKIFSRGEYIWNYGGKDPAGLLLNFKGGYSLTIPQGGASERRSLPSDYQHFLGGLTDLRGFGRLELPAGSTTNGVSANGIANRMANRVGGGLSSAFVSIEARPDLLSEQLIPMVFLDVGAIGLESYLPEGPIYASPGIGLNWISPVGTLRTTMARGMVWGRNDDPAQNSVSHWQLILSLGEAL
jgi:outer membrane translocation and assembly module TamA